MRIAQVAPLYESVPPVLYGGLVPISAQSLRLDPKCQDQLAHHVLMLERVFSEKRNFDVIHFHIDYLHFSLSRREHVINVTTLHGRLDIPDLQPLYQVFPDMPVVSISDSQREPLPTINWQGTVYHGMPRDIEIAKRANMPLKIAAKIDRADQQYFDNVIEPLLDSHLVEFVGEIGYPEKFDFLGDAAALLFPIDWPEPFGLVMIEAMACGTPVIAYPYGSVPEIMKEGVSGFIVPDAESAAAAVKNIGKIDRRKCRQYFEKRFTSTRMAEDYLAIYERLLKGQSAPIAHPEGALSWTKSA